MTLTNLYEQLKHPNPHLRDRAMWEIVENRDGETIPYLMGLLDGEDVVHRRAAVKTLGAIGIEAIPAIVDTLQSSDNVTVKSSCAKALAQVAVLYPEAEFPPEGLAGLKKALADANPVVHIAAAMALGEMGSPALDALIDGFNAALAEDNIGAAVAITNSLGAVGDDRTIAFLKDLANKEGIDSYIKETATSSLSRIDLAMNYRSQ
jgi:bilin biosynthesis protein